MKENIRGELSTRLNNYDGVCKRPLTVVPKIPCHRCLISSLVRHWNMKVVTCRVFFIPVLDVYRHMYNQQVHKAYPLVE